MRYTSDDEYSLADLTIICGKNNTGKTYATYALFGFLDYFKKGYTIKVPIKDVQNLLENGSLKIKLDYSLGGLSKHVRDACKHFLRYLPRIFAAQDSYFSNSSFRVELDESDINILDEFKRSYRSEKKDLLEIVKSKNNNDLTITLLQNSLDNEDSASLRIGIQRILGDAIKDILFRNIFPECFIASAERTGAVIFKDELNIEKNNLLREIVNVNELHIEDILDKIYNVSYALPVQRNIAFIRNLESISKGQSMLSKMHPVIMEKYSVITGGQYKVSSKGLTFIPTNCKSVKLTIGESGSSVRSLLDIYFYLIYIACPGQLLIIDEPEMNLHPESQRKFARLISSLVNYGIRVFVTTHSDYIIKELNTLIMLKSRLGQKHISSIIHKYGYSEDELLDISKIKVFVSCKNLMKLGNSTRRTKLQTLMEAHIDSIYGVSTNNFDDAINEMNQIQDSIIFGYNG